MHILILDYSVDRCESDLIKRWLPAEADKTSLFIDTEESFPDDLAMTGFTHVIHSGSILSITETAPFTPKAVAYIRHLRDRKIPQMGICYGHQLINLALLGKSAVRTSPKGFEVGWCDVSLFDAILGLPDTVQKITVWQHHFDEVVTLPANSKIIATNTHSSIQAYVNSDLYLFGTQFHPEFDWESGNQYFLKDRDLLSTHHFNVDEIVKRKPSIDTGALFFRFFLEYFTDK